MSLPINVSADVGKIKFKIKSLKNQTWWPRKQTCSLAKATVLHLKKPYFVIWKLWYLTRAAQFGEDGRRGKGGRGGSSVTLFRVSSGYIPLIPPIPFSAGPDQNLNALDVTTGISSTCV